MNETERHLQRIAAYGLGLPEAESPVCPTYEEWSVLRGGLQRERLTGLAAVAHAAGALELDETSTLELAELDARWAHQTLAAEDVLVTTVSLLQRAGIPVLVLKGASFAELSWQWGEARRWVDADVLIRPDRLDEAIELLVASGASRPVPELRRGFDRRFAKSVTLRSVPGPEIDVHRTLAPEPYGFVLPIEDLWEHPRSYVVEGTELSTVSAEVAWLHSCIHATVGGQRARLGSVRDVAEGFRDCDPAVLLTLARRWRARSIVRWAGELVSTRLGLPDHEVVSWSASVQSSNGDRRIAELHRSSSTSQRRRALASLRVIPGWADKLRFAWAFAMPSPENRRHRGRGGLFRRTR